MTAPAPVRRPSDVPDGVRDAAPLVQCDVCGAESLVPLRCKVICGNCRTILQSCADL